MLLFFNGGGNIPVNPTYPALIIMLSGRVALHVGGAIYMEL